MERRSKRKRSNESDSAMLIEHLRTDFQQASRHMENVSRHMENVSRRMDDAIRGIEQIQTRLESIESSMSPPERRALAETNAPPQSRQGEGSGGEERLMTASRRVAGCSNCDKVETELKELRRKVEEHKREREAWKAFKSWWLEGLKKRERRGGRKRKGNKQGEPNGEGNDGQEGEEEAEMDAIVGRIDEPTRQIWARAGMIPSSSTDSTDEGRGEERGESSNQQSEITLPLHAAAPPPLPPAAAPTDTFHPPASRTPAPRLTLPERSAAPNGVGHVDSTPVRNAHTRRTMIASDCPDCALFYSHFSDLNPTNPQAGIAERNACSRHRTTFPRATTPDGYWNIGFPTTQEAEQINAQAASARRRRPGAD